MNAGQLAAVIGGSIIIVAVAFLIFCEVRRPWPDPDSYLTEALREAIHEQRREMFKPYLLQHCQHPFADTWPDGRRACYQCGRQWAP